MDTQKKLKLIIFLLSAVVISSGCGTPPLYDKADVQQATIDDSENVDIFSEDEVQLDKFGRVKGLEGFEASESLADTSGLLADASALEGLRASEEPAFTFNTTEGRSIEYSEPSFQPSQMVASLRLTNIGDLKNKCESQNYSKDVPKIKDLFLVADDSGSCGRLRFEFCLKVSLNDFKDYQYIMSPPIIIPIPCKNNSFDSANIEINDGRKYTDSQSANIKFYTNSKIKHYSLSNTKGCESAEKNFKDLPSDNLLSGWNLEFVGNPAAATVYAKFKDLDGNISECVSSTVFWKTAENTEKPISEYKITDCNALESSQYLWLDNVCTELTSLSEENCRTLSSLNYFWGSTGGDNSCLHVESLSETNCQTFDSYIWNSSKCVARTGASSSVPSKSCKLILDNNFANTDGVYWLDPNAGDSSDAVQAYCALDTDGGNSSVILNSTVVREFAGRTVAFENLSINQTGSNFIQASAGELISLDLSWQSTYTSTYCPGCIQQFYVGLKDLGILCLYSGGTSNTRSGTDTLNINAPTNPGFYFIQAASSLQYSCTTTQSQLSDSATGAIAVIQVIN